MKLGGRRGGASGPSRKAGIRKTPIAVEVDGREVHHSAKLASLQAWEVHLRALAKKKYFLSTILAKLVAFSVTFPSTAHNSLTLLKFI